MAFSLALVGSFITLVNGDAWSYRNITAWRSIGMCDHVGDQSPIDVVQADAWPMTNCLPLSLVETDTEGKLETNEHTWEVHVEGSFPLLWENSNYHLQQFHFHSPSENKIDGAFFDMEAHMVHKNLATGQLLVVAQMFQVGPSANTFLSGFWSNFPKNATENEASQPIGNPYNLVAEDKPVEHYWHWAGSLTTPPCTNDTVWILAKSINTMSQEQMDEFRKGITEVPGSQTVVNRGFSPEGAGGTWNHSLGDDNRPVQPVNAPGQHTRHVYTCDTGMTTTTTAAPAWLPWWAWWLIAGLIILCVCCLIAGLVMFMSGKKSPKKGKRGVANKFESRPLMQQTPPASVNVPPAVPTHLMTPPMMVQAQPAPSMFYAPQTYAAPQAYAAPQTYAPYSPGTYPAGSVQMAPMPGMMPH